MLKLCEISDIHDNFVTLIGEKWGLVTAGTVEKANTMTVSWGNVGVLWSKPVATIYVRPQRYTYDFVEGTEGFSIAFFRTGYREELMRCGTESGRDIDKFDVCHFTQCHHEGVPYIGEADVVLICKKIYQDDIKPDHFLVDSLDEKHYPKKDYHRMYVGEIVACYQR